MPPSPHFNQIYASRVRRFSLIFALIGLLSFAIYVLSLVLSTPLSRTASLALILLTSSTWIMAAVMGIFYGWIARLLMALIRDQRRQRLALQGRLKHAVLSKAETIGLGMILLLGIGLRLMFLMQPIRTDEAVTYLHYASRSLPLALANYTAPNNHLFHTLFAWISVHLLGNTEMALRLPAFVMGVLLVPVSYGLGAVFANRRTGLLAAGLVAVSSVLIEYSTNARGYTLQCVLVGLAFLAASSARRSLSPVRWGVLAILLALGFYTVPTMLYAFGGLMLWLLVEILWDRQRAWRANKVIEGMPLRFIWAWVLCGVLTVILTLLLYTPVLIVSGVSAIIGNQYVQPFTFDVFLQHLPGAAQALWAHWHTSVPPLIAAILGVGALISLRWGLRVRFAPLLPCLAWSLMALALQRVIPFERNWLPFLPLYLMSAAAGLVWIWDRLPVRRAWLGWLAGVCLITMLAINIMMTRSPYTSIETGTFRDARAVVQDLQLLLQPGDRVILEHPSGDSLAYYAAQMGLDWQAYIDHDSTTGVVYGVLNTEYPQTMESVARWNGVSLADYTAETIRGYPLAELVKLEKKR